MQQADIDAAGLARLELLVEHLPGTAEDGAREQILAEHRVAEGLRLLDERTDQVTVVDLTDRLVAGAAIAARQRQHRRDAEVADEPVVVDVHLEAAADQARGHGVEDAAHADRARAGYAGGGDREVGRAVARQRMRAP